MIDVLTTFYIIHLNFRQLLPVLTLAEITLYFIRSTQSEHSNRRNSCENCAYASVYKLIPYTLLLRIRIIIVKRTFIRLTIIAI